MEYSNNQNKIFINVIAEFCTDGVVRPKSITWEDGRVYEIDHIIDIRKATSIEAGFRHVITQNGIIITRYNELGYYML